MKYYEEFARRFSRHDQRRRWYGAWVGFFVVLWCLFIAFNIYLAPLSFINFRVCKVYGIKSVSVINKTSNPELSYVKTKETKLICNTFNKRTKVCEINGGVRIQGTSSTIFVFRSQANNTSWIIKPYPRIGDISAMNRVTSFTIKSIPKRANTMPECTQTYNVPALVFSGGGYSGNNFHAFSEVIVPLYSTSHDFNREVWFLVANKHSKFTTKFQVILDKLSRYDIIDIDHDNEVHCFPSMIVGLKKEGKELYTKSMKDFTRFLRSSYSLERSTPINLTNDLEIRPRLLIVPRLRTRAFTNVKDVVYLAQQLGFEVIVEEMSANLTQVSRVVNSCDVMMGVHGAGLTNMVFMPENGVLIQVVPLGNMNWVVKSSFGAPSKEMGLKYLEYKISERESSLIEKYPLNHSVFMDPGSVKGWSAFHSIYLNKQNVTIDVVRFKDTLVKALDLLR